jgi:integrase
MAGREQSGVEQKCSGSWYFLYRDASGKRVREKLGPAEGPKKLNREQRYDRKRAILSSAFPDKAEVSKAETKAILTVKSAGDSWLHHSMSRRRKPISTNTATLYGHYLRRWIYPVIGEMLVSEIKNMQAKLVIDFMATHKASTSVINDVITNIQQIVEHPTDANGEPLYPVEWNREIMDAPAAKSIETKAFTAEQFEQIIQRAEGQYKVLFALLGLGLRIGEALAIEIGADPEKRTTLSKDCRVLNVQSIILQNGTWQDHPKTLASIREVDIPSNLAAMLKGFIGNRTSGYLFSTANDTPLLYSNLRKNILDPTLYDVERKQMKRQGKGWKCVGVKVIPGVVGPETTEGYGCHSFRRYRETFLSIEGVNQIYIDYWQGHGKKTIGELYKKIKGEGLKRRQMSEQVGLGFTLPESAEVVEINSKGKVKAA